MQKNEPLVSIPLWLAQELETDCEELAATYSGFDAGELYRKQARMLKAAIKTATASEKLTHKFYNELAGALAAMKGKEVNSDGEN